MKTLIVEKTNKIIALFIALVLVIGLVPTALFADDDVNAPPSKFKIKWTVDSLSLSEWAAKRQLSSDDISEIIAGVSFTAYKLNDDGSQSGVEHSGVLGPNDFIEFPESITQGKYVVVQKTTSAEARQYFGDSEVSNEYEYKYVYIADENGFHIDNNYFVSGQGGIGKKVKRIKQGEDVNWNLPDVWHGFFTGNTSEDDSQSVLSPASKANYDILYNMGAKWIWNREDTYVYGISGSAIEFRFNVFLDESLQTVPLYFAADNVAMIYVNGYLAAYSTVALEGRSTNTGDAYSSNVLGTLLYGDFDGRWKEGWNYAYNTNIALNEGANEIIILAANSASTGHLNEKGEFVRGDTGKDNDGYELNNNPCGLIFAFDIPKTAFAATFNNADVYRDVTVTKQVQDPEDENNWLKNANISSGETAKFKITVKNNGGKRTVYLSDIFDRTKDITTLYTSFEKPETASIEGNSIGETVIEFQANGEVVLYYEVTPPIFYNGDDATADSNKYKNIVTWHSKDGSGTDVDSGSDIAEITVVEAENPPETAPVIEIAKTIIGGNADDDKKSITVDSGSKVTFKIAITNSGTAAGNITLNDCFEYLNNSNSGYERVKIRVYGNDEDYEDDVDEDDEDDEDDENIVGLSDWLTDAAAGIISSSELTLPAGCTIVIYATVTMEYPTEDDSNTGEEGINGASADLNLLLEQYEAESEKLNELERTLSAAREALNTTDEGSNEEGDVTTGEHDPIVEPYTQPELPDGENDEPNEEPNEEEQSPDNDYMFEGTQSSELLITQEEYDGMLQEYEALFSGTERLLGQIDAIAYELNDIDGADNEIPSSQSRTYVNTATVSLNDIELEPVEATVTLIPGKEPTIVKEVSTYESADESDWNASAEIDSGSTAYFRITVTNNSKEPITNLRLSDFLSNEDVLFMVLLTDEDISANLDPGDSVTFTYDVSLTNESFDDFLVLTNSAKVTYTNSKDEDKEIETSAEVTVNPKKSAFATITGTKRLTGSNLRSGQFSFVLKDELGGTVATANNRANGDIRFENIRFTRADVYNYTVSEQNGNNSQVTYDNRVFNVKITVTESNGVLDRTAQVAYPGGAAAFVNVYSEGDGNNNGGGGGNTTEPDDDRDDDTDPTVTEEPKVTTKPDVTEEPDKTEETDKKEETDITDETIVTDEIEEENENNNPQDEEQQEDTSEPLEWEPAEWVSDSYVPTQVPDVYQMLDENGTPLGYFTPVLKDGGDPTNPDDYIWIEVDEYGTPLGAVIGLMKENPVTGQTDNFFKLSMLVALFFMGAALITGLTKKSHFRK